MIRTTRTHRENDYEPQAAKTLEQALIRFISQEFPRLGGPWIVERLVDKLLTMVDDYYVAHARLQPGQTVWPAVAIDERPGERKPLSETRLVPVVITVVNQDDVAQLCEQTEQRAWLQQALVRAAHDAYAQGGVLTCSDLSLLFHQSRSRVAALIRAHEQATGQVVPRRGTVHDIGGTVTHKAIICRKAYLEGKPTHVVARETCHSPEAVDRYVLDFARVFFAIVQRGMSAEQTAFAIQRPLRLVLEYLHLIQDFGLSQEQVYQRAGRQPTLSVEPAVECTSA